MPLHAHRDCNQSDQEEKCRGGRFSKSVAGPETKKTKGDKSRKAERLKAQGASRKVPAAATPGGFEHHFSGKKPQEERRDRRCPMQQFRPISVQTYKTLDTVFPVIWATKAWCRLRYPTISTTPAPQLSAPRSPPFPTRSTVSMLPASHLPRD